MELLHTAITTTTAATMRMRHTWNAGERRIAFTKTRTETGRDIVVMNAMVAIKEVQEERMSGKEIKGTTAEETIRCILEEEKMTQQDLADRMGTARQNVSQLLNRNAKSMRYDSFAKAV